MYKRQRAPQAPSTALITRTGYERLRDELDDLWRVRRPEAVSYTHLRAHETVLDLVCRLLLEKKNINHNQILVLLYCHMTLTI